MLEEKAKTLGPAHEHRDLRRKRFTTPLKKASSSPAPCGGQNLGSVVLAANPAVTSHRGESGLGAFECGRLISMPNGPHHRFHMRHRLDTFLRIREARWP